MVTSNGATFVSGTTDIGNHCDDCTTLITLPFPYTYYNDTSSTLRLPPGRGRNRCRKMTPFVNTAKGQFVKWDRS